MLGPIRWLGVFELCRRALELVDRGRDPESWATLQAELANSLMQSPNPEQAQNLELAIACYEAVLEVRTREAMPVEWALTHAMLAPAYANRICGSSAENLERAIAGYELALEVQTQGAYPWNISECN